MNNIPEIPSAYPPININNFNYVKDKGTRLMLQNAFQAITETNTWEFISKDIDSFVFSYLPEVEIIFKKMEKLGYTGHSGFSFGWTLRAMQYLVINGEEQFKINYLK
jgi:hypothetical protein